MYAVRIALRQERIWVWTPYDEDFIFDLKAEIPPRERSWKPEERCWTVAVNYASRLCDLLDSYFPHDEYASWHTAWRELWTYQRRAEDEAREQREEARREQARREEEARQREQARARAQTPHEVLYLLETAPMPVVDAAYRALARMYHPDTSTVDDAGETMRRLNLAYEQIQEAK